MKKKTIRVATVKDEGVTVGVQHIINENGKIYNGGAFGQDIVKQHQNGLQPRKRFHLWAKSINGVAAQLILDVTSTGKIHGIYTFGFRGFPSTPARRKMYVKHKAHRKRQLGFHPISFLHKGCVWHHVNETDVVACPAFVHSHVSHVCGDGKLEGVVG